MQNIKTYRQRMKDDPMLSALNAALFEIADLRMALIAHNSAALEFISRVHRYAEGKPDKHDIQVLLRSFS